MPSAEYDKLLAARKPLIPDLHSEERNKEEAEKKEKAEAKNKWDQKATSSHHKGKEPEQLNNLLWGDAPAVAKKESKKSEGGGWNDVQETKKSSKKSSKVSDNQGKAEEADGNSGGGWGDAEKDKAAEGNDGGDGGWGENGGNAWGENGGNAWGGDEQEAKGGDGGWGAAASSKKSASGSSRKSDTSSGARARREEPATPDTLVKPYWSDWAKPSDTDVRPIPRDVFKYAAKALPAVPSSAVGDRTHGVQTGMGAEYAHHSRVPAYLDTMEAPYAVFSFKYRSREVLKGILKTTIDGGQLEKVRRQVEEQRLSALPKHKLVQELMEKRGISTPGKGGFGSEKGWGAITPDPEPEKEGKEKKEKKEEEKKEEGGWGETKGDGGWGGGGDVKW